MKLFCELCNNKLEVEIENDKLIFICLVCKSKYPPDDIDSLRYEETTKDFDISIFEKILNRLADDPCNLKIKIACPECKHELAKMCRLGDEAKVVKACLGCKHMWI